MQGDLADAATVGLVRLGGYTLRERVGEGGMGVVHRAVDGRGHVVAVKLLRPHVACDDESRRRFAREARVLARVRGWHVAEVLDADVAAATPYLVTRFVSGPPLHEVVTSGGPLHGADLSDLAGDLADALCSIHGAGVVHRDLKPGNVLIQDGVAVVIDFGIAQIADETRMTVPGMVYGTPGYVAPEVLAGGEVSPAGDIHAWAATVAFAASGRPPYGTGPLEAVAYRVVHDEPDLADCPGWLEPVLRRCFAKDPHQRPAAPDLLRWLETGESPPAIQPVGGIPVARADDDESADAYDEPADEQYDEQYDGDYDEPYDQAVDEFNGEPRPLAQPYTAELAVPGADEEPSEEFYAEPSYDASAGYLGGHKVVVVALFGVLAALAAVFPAAAVAGLLGWLLLSRTVDRSAAFVERRRARRGPRRSDGLAAFAGLPWHAVRSGLLTALTFPIAVAGGVVLVALGVLLAYAGDVPARLDIVSGAVVLAVAALAWWGVSGGGVRGGSRRILGGVLRRRWMTVTAGFVSVALFLVLVGVASVEPVVWWPLDVDSLPSLVGQALDRWGS